MTESEVRLAVVIAILVVLGAVLIMAGCFKMAGDCSREEEREKRKLMPCPRCGKPPHLGYCCGEYFISGDDPNCPYCGTAFSEIHSSIDLEIDAWNRRAKNGGVHIHSQGSADR